MKRLAELALAAALALAAPAAHAATTCSGSNVFVNFGPYDVFNPVATDTQGSLVVTCTRIGGPATTTITVALGPSMTSGSTANRRMKHESRNEYLDYNFYRDASRISPWGDSSGVNTVSQNITLANNTSGSISFTLFGRIRQNQDARPGGYADSLLVTITF